MTQAPMDARLFTLGHSGHSLHTFLTLLSSHGVNMVIDVRSSPSSRLHPQFNRDLLVKPLEASGIHYEFLGRELGARREEPECYEAGKARYDLIARVPRFQQGLDYIRRGIENSRVSLVCAEKEPLCCHRAILICRYLKSDVGQIHHILEDGSLERHADAEARLLKLCGLPTSDLFHSYDELLEMAYEIQGDRIAYVAPAGKG